MFKKISILVSFLVIAIGVSFIVALMMGRHELDTQKKAWVALGGVLDPAELAPAEIPDAENAAVAYGPVFAYLDGLPKEESDLLGADPAKEPEVLAVLDKSADVIAQLRKASKIKDAQWGIDYEEGINVLLPHLGRMRKASRLLVSDARRAVAEGRDEDAVRDIEAILRMGLHVSNDQTLIGQLVTVAIMGQGILLYEELFRDRSAPVNDIAEIAAQYDSRKALRGALMCEVAMSETMMNQIAGDNANGGEVPAYAKVVFSWDRAYYLRTMGSAVAGCDKPYYDAPKIDASPPVYAVLSGLMMPSLDRATAALALGQLRVVMLETAEKLRAYKAEHGEYPEADAKDGVEIPIDPVTGKRLVYEKIGEGFVLTSDAVDRDGAKIEWVWEK